MSVTPPSASASAPWRVSLFNAIRTELVAGRFSDALACSWMALVYRDWGDFRALADAYAQVPTSRKETAWKTLTALDWSLAHQGANPLFALDEFPLMLIELCDELLGAQRHGTFAEELSVNETEDTYARGVICVDAPDAFFTQFGIVPTRQKVYLIARRKPSTTSPIQRQHIDPERYTRHWHVVPEFPDKNDTTRSVFALEASSGLVEACKTVALRDDQQLRVYLAEFDCSPEFDSHIVPNGDARATWVARDLLNRDAMTAAVKRHLEIAQGSKADVVVFPELMLPRWLRDTVSEWLANENQSDEPGGHAIGWVIAGSFHESASAGSSDPRPRNIAFALDARGVALQEFNHQKLTQVDLDALNVKEGNCPGGRITLTSTRIGIQTVVICLDLGQTGAYDRVPLDLLPIDWIWVPSLSQGVSAHLGRAHTICLQRPVTVACANQGHAKCSDTAELKGAPLQSFVMRIEGSKPASVKPAALPVPRSWQFFELSL